MTLPPELLDAIRAAPTDDAPRLALADWLDESGDPEWAEFVRLEVAPRAAPSGRGGRKVTARLAGRHRALAEATAPRRLGPRLASLGPTLAALTSGGLVTDIVFADTLDADILAAVAAVPLVTSFTHRPPERGEASRLAPADARLLAAAPALRAADFHVGPGELAWADVEPLADLPGLGTLAIRQGRRNLLTGTLKRRWAARRTRDAAARSPEEALAAARRGLTAGQFAEGPDGACVASLDNPTPETLALLDGLTHLRALHLGSTRERPMPTLPTLRCAWAGQGVRLRPSDWERLTDLRELTVEGFDPSAIPSGLRDILRSLPRLRALSLHWTAVERDALPPGLRVLHLAQAALPEPAAIDTPELVELDDPSLARPPRLGDGSTLPRLAVLRLSGGRIALRPSGGWGDEPPVLHANAETAVEYAIEHGTRHEAGGVSLTLPAWFESAEPPAGALAAWRDWGEPDGSDDLGLLAPTRVVLERLPGDFGRDDLPGLVASAPTALPARDADRRADRARRYSEPAVSAALFLSTGLGFVTGASAAQAWLAPGGAVRLRWDGAAARVLRVASLAVAVGRTVGFSGPLAPA